MTLIPILKYLLIRGQVDHVPLCVLNILYMHLNAALCRINTVRLCLPDSIHINIKSLYMVDEPWN